VTFGPVVPRLDAVGAAGWVLAPEAALLVGVLFAAEV
jgi:hypothetical protein